MKYYIVYNKISGDLVKMRGSNRELSLDITEEYDVLVLDERPLTLNFKVIDGDISYQIDREIDKDYRWSYLLSKISLVILIRIIFKSLIVLFQNTGATPPNELKLLKNKYDEIFNS